mgnify:CR=1 FL=1
MPIRTTWRAARSVGDDDAASDNDATIKITKTVMMLQKRITLDKVSLILLSKQSIIPQECGSALMQL